MSGLQPKTIKKVLQAKLAQWLDTIDDKDLENCISRDVIVTGGSIASMLLGESPNDYDVYFSNIETTKRVAEYYINKLKEKNPTLEVCVKIEDRENIKCEIETRVVNYIRSVGVIDGDPNAEPDELGKEILSGISSLTNGIKIESDINAEELYHPVFISENAITLSHKLQLVTRFYGEPNKIHDNFDYIHACNWYRYKDNHLELNADALSALMSKRLIYRGSLYPLASLFRMRKFLERGFKISAGQILKISLQISEIDLMHVPTLREQLIGVDMAYFYMLIDAIEQAKQSDKELKLDSTYIGELIDRIFG